jgi:hypothetical protein
MYGCSFTCHATPTHTQVASAAQVWRQVYPERPPDVVVVASSLWDLARMSAYEPHLMAGNEPYEA